jgi:hypothetical protein
MIKWISICLIALSSFLHLQLVGQTIDQTLDAGRAAYKNGDFLVAQSMLERAFYFQTETAKFTDYELLFNSYLNQANYPMAYQTLFRAQIDYSTNDSIENQIKLSQARLSLHKDNLEEMKYWLFQIDQHYGLDQMQQSYSMLALCHFLLGEFEESDEALGHLPNYSVWSQTKDFEGIFKKAKGAEKLKPSLAYLFSVFVPGSGQLYAGFPDEALNSFVLNGALVYVYFNVLLTFSFFEAFILIYPWFARYYNGGYKRAGDLAKMKKQSAKYKEASRLMEFLEMQATSY